MPDHFDEWGTEAHGEGLSRTWVGIMAASRDELPLVGAVPDEDGVFIAAGVSRFNPKFRAPVRGGVRKGSTGRAPHPATWGATPSHLASHPA
jgi:hypothetical protein